MIDVETARREVLDRSAPRSVIRTAFESALGLRLAIDVLSDIDSPPHDKSLVDGYALRSCDCRPGVVELDVIEEVMAGDVPKLSVAANQATRIMTGAPIPIGADAVVMVEETETGDAGRVVLVRSSPVEVGQHIMTRGTSLRSGDVVLARGHEVRPIEIGLLAEVGAVEVEVYRRPTVAIISTGDELVDPHLRPGIGQIRNSNGPMLSALVQRAGGTPVVLGIGRDRHEALRELIASGLEQDILLLSGGVSAGARDLVPAVLEELAVQQVFHKVQLKPGKPLWFGTKQHPNGDRLVFGLPGNPVSGLVCFELFVRAAIETLSGAVASQGVASNAAQLTHVHHQRGDRETYFPATHFCQDDRSLVTPLNWKGSADLKTLCQANVLVHFPPGTRSYEVDETVRVVPID